MGIFKISKNYKKTQVRLQRLFEIKYVTATNISCDEENFWWKIAQLDSQWNFRKKGLFTNALAFVHNIFFILDVILFILLYVTDWMSL